MNAVNPITKPKEVAPAFDDESPDEEILAAFERVRALRDHGYTMDHIGPKGWSETSEVKRNDAEMLHCEQAVYGNWATTIPGAVAKISLLLPCIDETRWVDQTMMQQGLEAVFAERKELDGNASILVDIAKNLIDIEFEQVFDAYTKARETYQEMTDLLALVEAEGARQRDAGGETEAIVAIEKLVDRLTGELSDHEAILHLMRTLAPDWVCYHRKASTLIREGYADEAAPWLLRDVNFLSARGAE